MNIDISNAHCGPWRHIQDHSCLRAGCIKIYATLRVEICAFDGSPQFTLCNWGVCSNIIVRVLSVCNWLADRRVVYARVTGDSSMICLSCLRRGSSYVTACVYVYTLMRRSFSILVSHLQLFICSTTSRRTRRPKSASTSPPPSTLYNNMGVVVVVVVVALTDIVSASSFYRWPQIREDHPPNLSILVSGGKETN